MLVLKFFLLVLFSFSFENLCYSKSNNIDICSIWSTNWRASNQIKQTIYAGVKPAGGTEAGKYSKIKVESWDECVTQCCEFNRCNVAYWISSTCLHIECISDDMCQPIENDNTDTNDETFYLQVRSVQSTAAAIDFDDTGIDECNETRLCSINERCEQVSINAQLKRNVCACNRENGYRRITGICRQYLPRTKPCALYEKDYEVSDNEIEDNSRGRCRKNEECLPPNDRAKHGYCQCKLGYIRQNDNGNCILDKQEDLLTTSTKSNSISSSSSSSSSSSPSSSLDIEVQAGDDQIITLPTNQVDLNGHILYKSNKSEIDFSILNKENYTLFWSLKSSSNRAKIDISNQEDLSSHIVVKQLREGIYEFELKLNNKQGITLASDTVKVEVVSAKTTTPAPLVLKLISPVTIHLPQQVIKLEAQVEPYNRRVVYQWTYVKGGPIIPTLQNVDKSDLLVSNIRPGNYSFQLRVIDNLDNEQIKSVQLIALGEPIEARVTNSREIVFWPSNDVILDGTPSILEEKTAIIWTLISNDNKQKSNEIEILSPHSLKTRISNLRIGQYKFQLTLTTNDQAYISKKDIVVIVYSQNGQPPKVNIKLETPYVNILNNLLILNASLTTADYGIAKWQWIKQSLSPAMGYFINNSNLLPVAYLTNLIEGQYIFTLQVTDDRQQMSEMNITIHVDGISDAENLIEIQFLSKPYLYQQTLDNLIAQIRVFLIDLYSNINILIVGMPKENLLLIKGIDSKTEMIIPPKYIVNHLQNKINSLRSASNMNILSINTYLCLSNCSNRGICDHKTKHCVCKKYYMENWFKAFVNKEPNCDFIIHYFVLISILGLIFSISFCWLCCCCCLRWRRRRNLLERRKRIRYQLLGENDEDDEQEVVQTKKQKSKSKSRSNKIKTTSVALSDSDMSDEQTLYDKPLLESKVDMNSPTVKTRGLKVAIQDSNGSPMVRNNGQSPTTTDNSVA